MDSRYSKRRLTIGQFAQPVKTPYEAKLFIELYFRHTQRKNGRTGKVNWSVMTAEWNAHVLQCLKQSNGVDATLKHQCHLKTFAANTVELFDQSHSSALQMAQRQLAQASLRSFLPPTVVPSGQENPVPQAPLVISAPPEIPAGTGYGGKGGGKKCRLCFVIENKTVLGKDGHLESCKYQIMLEKATKAGKDSAEFLELEALVSVANDKFQRKKKESLLKMYRDKWSD